MRARRTLASWTAAAWCRAAPSATAAPRRASGSHSGSHLIFCEAGLRARFVVKPPPTAADITNVFKARSPSQAVVGLDLEPSHIAAAEVDAERHAEDRARRRRPARPGACATARSPTPTRSPRASASCSPRNDLGRRVRIGLAHQRVVVRTLDLPLIEDRKAPRRRRPLPGPGPHPDADGRGGHRLPGPRRRRRPRRARAPASSSSRSAARRSTGWSASSAPPASSSSASTSPPSPCCARLDAAPGRPARPSSTRTSAGSTNLAVASGARACSRAPPPGGLESLAVTLADQCSLTLEHARQWLKHVGPATPLEEVAGDADDRRRRARRADRRRPPDRRHRAQHAELLPHAGPRRARGAAPS